MSDYLRDCNTGDLKTDPKTFQETWCKRCSRKECSLALYAHTDPMLQRQMTWRERFFGAPQADLSLPQFARISSLDFPNLLQKAMKLEISERRGDWSVPDIPGIPVLDGVAEVATSAVTSSLDDAVRKLSRKPEVEEEEEESEPEIEPEPAAPVAPLPRKPQPPRPLQVNTPDPGEVMIGGGSVPVPNPRTPPVDPWAPPAKPSVTVVKKGAKIRFGTDGKITHE